MPVAPQLQGKTQTMSFSTSAYKQMLDLQTTSVALLDDQLRICYLNPAAESILQRSNNRSQGENIAQVIGSDSTIALKACLASGRAYSCREAEIHLSDSSTLIVDYTASQIINSDGQVQLLLELQNRDRLVRMRKEKQMLANQEMTRSLVRGMAHEIKNPLGGIRGSAQLLSRALPDESLTEYTTIIIEEADRLRDLVDRILGPHKLPKFELINLHEVLERVHQLIEVENPELEIQRDYDPSIPELFADKSQLIQVVLNICRNAIQALGETGQKHQQLTLRSRAIRQFTIGPKKHRLVAHIQICDNGPGIPAEIRNNLFYPMVTGRAEGTGLGLSIAQTLIHHHHGIIEFSSQPGDTKFSIYLPFSSLEELSTPNKK